MITTIIFDFGDIFINLDKPATVRELQKYEMKGFSDASQKKNNAYEKGQISSSEFISHYQEILPHLNKNAFINSWNAVLVDFPEYRLDFIKSLFKKGKFKLILLSNTNEIHIDWVKKHVPFFEEFKNCFDAFYLSHEINFRKPNADIYEFVLKTNDLQPEECLFIDDTKENTCAAAELGIHVWNLNPETEDITHLFEVKKDLF